MSDTALLRYTIRSKDNKEVSGVVLEEFYDILKEVLGSTDVFSPDGHGNILLLLIGKNVEDAGRLSDIIMEKWSTDPYSQDCMINIEKEML